MTREEFKDLVSRRDNAKARYHTARDMREFARSDARESLERHREVLRRRDAAEEECDAAWREYRALDAEIPLAFSTVKYW